jgi:glucose/mannose transport system substrate-binding protein
MRLNKNAGCHALLIAGLASAAIGCADGGEDSQTENTPSGNVEIFSWWTSGGEVEALNALIGVYENKYPKAHVVNLAEDLAEEARDRLVQRMAEGAPPDTFQANIGTDLSKWVLFNDVDDAASKVEPLNAVAEKNGWRKAFPPVVVDALSHNGKIYGVPANIHRINSLFYSVKAFTAAGVEPPTTTAALLTVAEQLKAAGYTPICIGSEHWWTVSLLAFENVFPAIAGGDFYASFWSGKEDPNAVKVNDALDYLLQLWPYVNADADSLEWTGGVDHMFDTNNACAMTVMGDWAKGYLESKGWKAGVDFQQIPFPGSNGTFVFTADTFPLPKGAPNRTAALALLETIGSVEGQIAFNVVKGSIPVRTDVDPMEFDETARNTMADFRSNNLVKAMSGLLPQDSFQDLGPAVKDMLATRNKEAVLNVLKNDYAVLK